MAHVHLSDRIQSHIIESATKGLVQQIAVLENEIRLGIDPNDFYEHIVPIKIRDTLKDIPEEYLSTAHTARVRMADPKGNLHWDLNWLKERVWDNSKNSYHMFDLGPDIKGYAETKVKLDRRNTLLGELVSLRAGLEKLLESCTTLKQAVAAWPTVLDHVGHEVRTLHNAPAAKRAVSAALTEIDPNVQAVLVKATMLAQK